MTSLGSILWIVAIGALFYYMMRKGGGHNHGNKNKDGHETRKKELGDHSLEDDPKQPTGGCCG